MCDQAEHLAEAFWSTRFALLALLARKKIVLRDPGFPTADDNASEGAVLGVNRSTKGSGANRCERLGILLCRSTVVSDARTEARVQRV